MRISENFIRRYPEQYVWYYKRFYYIPREADETLRSRYPWYSIAAPPTFYDNTERRKQTGK